MAPYANLKNGKKVVSAFTLFARVKEKNKNKNRKKILKVLDNDFSYGFIYLVNSSSSLLLMLLLFLLLPLVLLPIFNTVLDSKEKQFYENISFPEEKTLSN